MAELDTVMNDLELCTHPTPSACRKCTHKGIPDDCPHCFMRLAADALELLKEHQWNDASKRPPKQGRYLVWGLHEFTPDHNDQPNAYWQTRIATWFEKTGWNTKVKFWMELPEPPENKGR